MECCLELLDRGTLRSLQDLGAAGLSSSSSEMASKGEVGLDIDVSQVPLREDDMEPFEIMISESQERMLCVIEPERLDELEEVCDRWEVRATAIGEVTDTRRLRVLHGDELVGDMPVDALVDDCPLYDLAPAAPGRPRSTPRPRACSSTDDPREVLPALLGSANLSSRRPLFEQYDPIVESRTVRRPEQADAAVLQLDPTAGLAAGIAVSIDGNGRRVACDPYTGTVEAVLECAANLACVGGRAARPHQLPQLRQPREAARGVAAASARWRAWPTRSRRSGVPVVGGNVSLYNESGGGPIYPTPVVGMVGAVPDVARRARARVRRARATLIALLAPRGFARSRHAGSELAKLRGRGAAARAARHRRGGGAGVHRRCVRGAAAASSPAPTTSPRAALAVALAECCLAGGIGATVGWDGDGDPLTQLFGEGVGRFVVSGARRIDRGPASDLPTSIGTVGGDCPGVGRR